jgi:5'-methylthioadenosine phosphorylase
MIAKDVVFLARHGKSHEYLPHEVNYRANIWALKKLGVTRAIGISAVGSLRHHLKPGDLCIPGQYFDFVKGAREKSFFGGGLAAHISTAEPTCPALTKALSHAGQDRDIEIHTGVTYACVDGPRLGTRAESFFLKDSAKCDLVGMTNVPEAFLARGCDRL